HQPEYYALEVLEKEGKQRRRGEKTKIETPGMDRRHPVRCGGRNADPMADHGSVHHSNTVYGEFPPGRRLPFRKQIPLRHANNHHAASNPTHPPKDLVYEHSFLSRLD